MFIVRAAVCCVVAAGSTAAAIHPVNQQPVERAVCDRLLPAPALATDAGTGFVLSSFDEADPDDWRCSWQTRGEPQRQLSVRYRRVGADRVRDIFRDELLKPITAGVPMENVYDIGSVAVLATLGESLLMLARNDDAIVTVTTTGLTRVQVLAVSQRVAGTPTATIADARAALAKSRGQSTKPFESLPALPDVVVRRNGQPLECERLLPRSKVVAVLGDAYRLVEANDPRPGFSFCEWKRPTDDYPFALRVHAEPEFTGAKVKGAEGFFTLEVSFSPCKQTPGEPLKGIGEQAVLCSGGGSYFNVIIRRAKDVLALSCFTCRREQMVALAQAAVQ